MNNPKKAKVLNINKCMNCGLCSYVCPSKIEVREKIKAIKEALK
jgi:electron transport complex protein RnfC